MEGLIGKTDDRGLLAAGMMFRIAAIVGAVTILQIHLESLGASPFIISMLEASGWVGFLLTSVPWSRYTDSTESYKHVLLFAILSTAVLLPFFGLLTTALVLILFRMVVSLCASGFTPIALGMVSRRSVKRERGKNISYVTAGKSAGFATARITAGFLLAWTTYQVGYTVYGGIAFLGFLCLLFLTPDTITYTARQTMDNLRQFFKYTSPADMKDMLKENGYGYLLGGLTLRKAAVFGMMSLIAVFIISEKQMSPIFMGFIIAVNPLTQVIGKLVFGRVADRIGRKNVFATGFLLSAASPVILAHSLSIYGLAAGFFVLGIAFSMIDTGSNAFIGDIASEDKESEYMSFRMVANAIAGITGSLTAGAVATVYGFSSMMYVMAAMMLGSFILVAFKTHETLVQ